MGFQLLAAPQAGPNGIPSASRCKSPRCPEKHAVHNDSHVLLATPPQNSKKARSGERASKSLEAEDYRAFLATSTREANASGSLMAMSERTLRSSSTPAFFRPFMNTE